MSGVRWSRWCLSLVAVAACTRENPNYELGAADSGTTSQGVTSSSGEGTVTMTTIDQSTGPTLDTGEETSTGVGECMPDFRPPFGFSASPPLGLPNCMDPFTFSASNVALRPGGELTVWLCESCPCGDGNGVAHTITTEIPMPPVSGCYELTVQPRPRGDRFCGLAAYAVSENGVPLSIVSNVVDPTFEEPFDFSLGNSPDGCDAGCAMPSGHYTLRSITDDSVPPNGRQEILPTDAQDYQVWNVGSGLDHECKPVGRWYAMLFGG